MESTKIVLGSVHTGGGLAKNAPGNLLGVGSLQGLRDNILDDESEDIHMQMQDDMSLPQAVVILLTDDKGRVLTVSDGPNSTMPGGSVELGESLEDAAHRELKEETGIDASWLVPIFKGMTGETMTTTFKALRYSGKFQSSDEGEVGWSTTKEVMQSQYGDYFKKLMSSIVMNNTPK